MIVGRRYVQLVDIRHWYLPLCVPNGFILNSVLEVSVHLFFLFFFNLVS